MSKKPQKIQSEIRSELHCDRRSFIQTGLTLTGLSFLPFSLKASPNGKVRTAHIGVGGKGGSDLSSIASHPMVEVTALCDIDTNRSAKAVKKYPNARFYADYRELYAALGDKIDAVVVSTPDHTHAPAAMMALNMGKHVYCQKPLTHNIYESRQLTKAAARTQLVTQMGNQLHATTYHRGTAQAVQSGVIGKVKEVYAWCGKNWGYDGPAFTGKDAVPDHINWDLWLGPATDRPYKNKVYHPGQWRKLLDFGVGTLGDMGVHIFDTPYRSMKLTSPLTVTNHCRKPTGVGHPTANHVEYKFKGTQYTTETMKWVWFDGSAAVGASLAQSLRDNNADLTPETFKIKQWARMGAIYVGEQGMLYAPYMKASIIHSENPDFKLPELPRINHYHQWVDAILGQTKADSHFGYAGPLTESILLGVVANRFPGETLTWDADALKSPSHSDADKLIRGHTYREGFKVENL